ncbi:hypothetical protein AHAS_Ahas11G0199200 [Arachis hypogaea]
MNSQDKLLLEASSGGSLTKSKTAEEAWEIIADLANSTQHLRARNPQPKALRSINAITLRSGTKLDEIGFVPTSLSEEAHKEEVGDDVGVMKDEEKNVEKGEEEPLKPKEPKRKNPLEEPMPIPFPTLDKKAKKHEKLYPNMVEIFKNVKVTIPIF